MRLYIPIIPMRYATPLLELVRRRRPKQLAQLLAAADVAPSSVDQQDAALTIAQFDRLLCAASELLGRDDLGFELGLRIDMYNHAALSLAMQRCNTLHELLTFFARYWCLITTCFAVEYRRHVDRVEWIIRPAAGMSQATLYMMEELFAVSFSTDFAKLLGNQRGLEVHLSSPRPPHLRRYESLRPSRFFFSANALPEVRCVVPITLADSPLLGWRRDAAASEPPDRDSTTESTTRCGAWVALMLREADGVQPSREMLADLLGMSPRTLSRNLAAEGIDFRRLARSIRLGRARAMLLDPSWSVTDIAYRLGYRDVAAFTHAFRKAYQISPREYRLSSGNKYQVFGPIVPDSPQSVAHTPLEWGRTS
jgi:AraC-like DNA-binding protein